MWIGHRKEIRKLTFRALALRRTNRRKASARNVSFRISLRWPIHIINPIDNTTDMSTYTDTLTMRSPTLHRYTYIPANSHALGVSLTPTGWKLRSTPVGQFLTPDWKMWVAAVLLDTISKNMSSQTRVRNENHV